MLCKLCTTHVTSIVLSQKELLNVTLSPRFVQDSIKFDMSKKSHSRAAWFFSPSLENAEMVNPEKCFVRRFFESISVSLVGRFSVAKGKKMNIGKFQVNTRTRTNRTTNTVEKMKNMPIMCVMNSFE